jgi:hypothetical protein
MRAARPARDHPRVQQTVGSIGLTLTPLAGAVVPVCPPAGTPVANDAPHFDPDLTWQSSIGQVIFLQSLASDRH